MGKGVQYFSGRVQHVQPKNIHTVTNEFDTWWKSRKTDYDRAKLLDDFHIPVKLDFAMDAFMDIELVGHTHEQLIPVIGPSVRNSLRQFTQDKNQSRMLRHAIKNLLDHNEWLRNHPRRAVDPQKADAYHLLASEVLVYQLLHNDCQEVLQRYTDFMYFVSGQRNPRLEAVGVLLMMIGVAAIVGGVALMPQPAFSYALQNSPAAITLFSIGAACAISAAITLSKGVQRDVSYRMARIRRQLGHGESLWARKEEKHPPLGLMIVN